MAGLDRALRASRPVAVALTGPPGSGKTTVLLVWAARRSAQTRVLVLPHAALPAEEICAWALGLMGAPLDGSPEVSLRAAAARVLSATGRPLVLAIDDADALPLASAHRLAALVAECEGSLRLVLAASDHRPHRTLAAMGPALEELRLAAGMSREETEAFVRARLERAGRPGAEARAPFGPEGLDLLHRATGGLPGRVESVAEALERADGRVEAPPEPAPAPREFADPFTSAPDPEGYVPRPATERALAELEAALAGEAHAVGLVGPSGMGRTLLLRLVAERARESHRAVLLPYSALEADELYHLALALAGEEPGEAPEEGLLDLAARTAEAGRTLLLLLDDAGSLPEAAWARLEALLERAEGAVRLVAVFRSEELRPGGRGPPLAGARWVRLEAPLDAEETRAYLEARVEQARLPAELRALFEGEAARDLHRASGGVPRELHRHADARLRAHAARPGTFRAGASDEPSPAPARRPRPRRRSPPPPPRPRRLPLVLGALLLLAVAAGFAAALTGLGPLGEPGALLEWLPGAPPAEPPAPPGP